eukprot:SM000324S12583  [mRNA]  locus=s324:5037:10923:+ [translate_table: standard]
MARAAAAAAAAAPSRRGGSPSSLPCSVRHGRSRCTGGLRARAKANVERLTGIDKENKKGQQSRDRQFESLVPNFLYPSFNVLSGPSKLARLGLLATGVTAAFCSMQIGVKILEAVDAVPILPQFEVLVGSILSTNFMTKYLLGGEGRARLLSFFEGAWDQISGISIEQLNEPEPSMLDVQLRALVDEHLATMETGSGEPATAQLLDKQSLLIELKNFVSSRDRKARQINAVLRKDIQELQLEKVMIVDRKVSQLQSEVNLLKGEQKDALEHVSSLTAKLTEASHELGCMRQSMQELEAVNRELQELVLAADVEKKALQDGILAAEASLKKAEEGHARQVHEIRAELLYQLEKSKEDQAALMQSRKSAADSEQAKHLRTIRDMEITIKEKDASAVTLQASIEQYRQDEAKLQEQSSQLAMEKEVLSQQMKVLEKGRAEAEAALKDAEVRLHMDLVRGRQDLQEQMQAVKKDHQLAICSLEEALRLKSEECARAASKVKETNADVQQLLACLAKAQEETAKTKASALETASSSRELVEQVHMLEKEKADLIAGSEAAQTKHLDELKKSQLDLLQKLEAAKNEEMAAARAYKESLNEQKSQHTEALQQVQLISATHKQRADSLETALAKLDVDQATVKREATLPLAALKEEAVISPLGNQLMDERRQEEGDASPSDLDGKVAQTEEVIAAGLEASVAPKREPERTFTEKELMAHCGEIRKQYVDIAKPAKEQKAGVEALVQALVHLGANPKWASEYVLRSMTYECSKARKST